MQPLIGVEIQYLQYISTVCCLYCFSKHLVLQRTFLDCVYSTVQYSTVAIFLLFFTSWIPNKLGPWTRVAVVGALKIYSSFFLYF